MSDDLSNQPVDQTIEITPVTSPEVTKIGSEPFVKELNKLLKDKKACWRSAAGLAESLGVDAIDLDKWLRNQTEIVCRSGKKEGTVYYALLSRVQSDKESSEAETKVKKAMSRPLTTEEDRYATAILHQCYVNLSEALDKYAMRIAERQMEGFQQLVQARDRLEAGITLYAGAVKADLKKLPRL